MSILQFYHQILLTLLSLTGYTNDKEKFAIEFLGACHDIAFGTVLELVPYEQQEKIKQQLQSAPNLEEVQIMLQQAISFDGYKGEFEKCFTKELQASLTSVFPTLYPEEKKAVEEYLETLPFGSKIKPQ